MSAQLNRYHHVLCHHVGGHVRHYAYGWIVGLCGMGYAGVLGAGWTIEGV